MPSGDKKLTNFTKKKFCRSGEEGITEEKTLSQIAQEPLHGGRLIFMALLPTPPPFNMGLNFNKS